ncbi:transposase [Mesorhizobium sp. M0208]|uniref:transposase n=1 Tax=Mesorhizobium sp. M0208 TaxID=2956916 RepID=UPI0033384247
MGLAPAWGQGTGRYGLPAEAVLRCALLKKYRQLSYQELVFDLEDSASFRALAGCVRLEPRRSRFCTTRSARFGLRPGKKSIGRCI